MIKDAVHRHTHTHTHIYIYIYIFMLKNSLLFFWCVCLSWTTTFLIIKE